MSSIASAPAASPGLADPAPAPPAPGHARRWPTPLLRLAPVAVAIAAATAYLVAAPMSLDLAAAEYRAQLFGRQGLSLWDPGWYGGHHVLGYSVTVPALSWWLGTRLLGALSAVAATVLFERLAWRRHGARSVPASLWFAAGSITSVLSGRITFAVGTVVGLGAVVALERAVRDDTSPARRASACAVALAILTALTSPVAALFVAVAGGAVAVARRRAVGVAVAGTALATAAAMAAVFPEGGVEDFPRHAFVTAVVLAGAVLVAAPRAARTIRVGVALYMLGVAVAYWCPTAVGSNVTRLGALCAGPVLALALCAGGARRRTLVALAVVAPALLWWQWADARADLRTAGHDPSTSARYYAPLLGELDRLRARDPRALVGDRLEIPFTRLHWESRWVAPHVALARGWERQLDGHANAIFYDGAPTPRSYRAWLRADAVRWVAIAHTRLDYSAVGEARLVAGGLPYLREVWRNPEWTLYAVRAPSALVSSPGRVTAVDGDTVTLRVPRPTTVALRVRWSPYWAVIRGDGCVAPDGAWTALTATTGGTIELAPRFAVDRIGARSPRCSAGAPTHRGAR